MKCFNHRELDAIAVCKHCGRALCSTCVSDVGGISSCKGKCEAAVAATLAEVEQHRRSLDLQGPIWNGLARFCYLLGLVMGGFGAYALFALAQPPAVSLLPLTIGFVLCLSGYGFQRYAVELKRRVTTIP